MGKRGGFSEPWTKDASGEAVVDRDGKDVVLDVTGMDRRHVDRLALCVNVLAGRVPSKLAELVAAITSWLDSPYCKAPYDTTNEAERSFDEHVAEVAAALAAFRGETP